MAAHDNDSMYDVSDGMTTLADGNLSIVYTCGNDTHCLERLSVEAIVRIVVPIFYGLIVIIGVIGNMLVVVVVVSNKQMRNTTNLLIINLAAADLLFIIICVPFTAAIYVLPVWPFGEVWCKIYQYMVNVTAYASVYTLVCMSLDRYLAVVHPLRSMTIRTERNANIVISLMWVVILIVNFPTALDHGLITYRMLGEERVACLNLHIQEPKAQMMYASFFTFGYLVPLLSVSILYGFMLNRLLYRAIPGKGSQSSESIRSKKRVTYMVIIVVVIFALCWLPIQVIFLMLYVFNNYPEGTIFTAIKLVSSCLAYMNSCVNPFLYAFLSENFRKSFRKILCGQKQMQSSRLEFERTNARGLEPLTRTTAVNGKHGVAIEEQLPNCDNDIEQDNQIIEQDTPITEKNSPTNELE